MSHNANINPTITGGRQSRFVKDRIAVRNFRTDRQSEQHIQTLGVYLAGVGADVPSISMLLRRAVAVYQDHLKAIAATPHLIEAEKKKVREGSILPSPDRKKKKVAREQVKADLAEAWNKEAARQHAAHEVRQAHAAKQPTTPITSSAE